MHFTNRKIVAWTQVLLDTKFGLVNYEVFWEPRLGDAFLATVPHKTETHPHRWGYLREKQEDRVWLHKRITVRARRKGLSTKVIAPKMKGTFLYFNGERIESFVPVFYNDCFETSIANYIIIDSIERQ
jgi:hypothetical protein